MTTQHIRRLALVATAVALAACAGGSAAPSASPSPPASPAISADLGIDLNEYTRTPMGLYYKDLKLGDGKVAVANSRVVVAYRGALARTGAQIDSSGGFAISISSDPIIRGWKLGIPGMKEGGVRNLVIPPELGYGSRELPNVPPHSTLVFQIQLRQVR
jgi:FKBP-type peptidyl-prolyl cis-trans isomerase